MASRLSTFSVHHLTQHGPATLQDLGEAARSAGATGARDPAGALRQAISHDPRFVEWPDGRWDSGLRLLTGAVLTHRVHSETSGRTMLFSGVDLAPLALFAEEAPLPLAGGGELTTGPRRPRDVDCAPVLLGPAGWLPEVPADGLVGLTWTADGVRVSAVELDPETSTERSAAVRAALARHGRRSLHPAGLEPGIVTRAVWSALVEVPDLLAEPVVPLDEVLGLRADRWPGDQTGRAREGTQTLTINAAPNGLVNALERHALALGRTSSELAVEHLAAASWRWEQPCRHDLRRGGYHDDAWDEQYPDDPWSTFDEPWEPELSAFR